MKRIFFTGLLGVLFYGYAAPVSADTAEDTAIEDTASLGDTAEDTAIEDTSTLGDTAEDDTADTADTATEPADTGDTSTADTADTGDTSVVTPASTLANEKGGFGCSSVGVGGVFAITFSLMVLSLRRRESH